MEDNNPAINTFFQETQELLEGLEDLLLDLEGNPDVEQIDAAFRVLHTVKGSGAMFGFGALARFTHHFEDAFDRVRDGLLAVDARLIDLSLKARDHMISLLMCGMNDAETAKLENSSQAAALLQALEEITGGVSGGAVTQTEGPGPVSPSMTMRNWFINFKPEANALRNGMRPDLLLAELVEMGKVTVKVELSALPALETMDPTLSWLGWHITLETHLPRSAVEAVFIFADDAELEIEEIMTPAVTPEPVEAINNKQITDVPQLTDPKRGMHEPVKPDQDEVKRKTSEKTGENVRVPAARLDEVMDQLGELVIAQARLSQLAKTLFDPELEAVVEEVERLVTGLRDATLSIRMLPIETVFGKFRRVVRDLSVELGKDVTLFTSGGETEIDKSVIDRLSEPLVHMIRNSMDHGIENTEIRKIAGKSGCGKVCLSARQEGGEVLITIEDDGAGLNAEAIRIKAIERGLLQAGAQPSDADLYNLIFAPGFSTASQVSSVSGRGVGMDAVRTTIDGLRGSVEIDSIPGAGTKVTLRLPVTLAIIDGLLVRLSEAVFVIPLAAVEECVELDAAEQRRKSGRTMLCIREHLVPFLDLDEVFAREPSKDNNRRVVIVKADGQRLGLVVDDIIGQHQTVIKTFSQYHRDIEGFSGATILGDGSVALIIDVVTLVRRALTNRAKQQIAA